MRYAGRDDDETARRIRLHICGIEFRSLAEEPCSFDDSDKFILWVRVRGNNKAAGFVSYGSAGGTRAVEQLRLVMAEIQVADVRAQVMLSLREDFENMSAFKPRAHHDKAVHTMLDQLVLWAEAMRQVRSRRTKAA